MYPEEKLALIQKMRQDEQRNYERMGIRKDFGRYTKGDLQPVAVSGEQISLFSSSLRLRFLFSLFLFLSFFYLDINNLSYGRLDSDLIREQISKTLSLSLSDLMTFLH